MKEVKLIGNIGKMEMKYTPQGKAVTEFTIAVNEGSGDNKTTEWYKAVAWEKAGELINQYAGVGSKIYVSGKFKVETWTSKEGDARASLVVTVQNFEFLSQKKAEQAHADVGDGDNVGFL